MKLKLLLAGSLSLTLLACTVPARPLSPGSAPAIGTRLAPARARETVRVRLRPAGYRTQAASLRQLAFVRVEVVGEGISGTLTQDGPAFISVTPSGIEATVSGIPLDDGALRVVTLRGFDADQNPLEAFTISGVYRSQRGVDTVTPVLSRRDLLLGNVIRQALGDEPELLVDLDIAALQTVLDQATGYDPGSRALFDTDPGQFDAEAVLDLLPVGGPLPDAADIITNALPDLDTVSLVVSTPLGDALDETLNLVLDDPYSSPGLIPRGTLDGGSVEIEDVPRGNWNLRVFRANGDLAAETSVSVTEAGVTIADSPLALLDVGEFIPEFQVNDFTSSGQNSVDLAGDAAGNFVAVWGSGDQDGDRTGIIGQRFDAQGAQLGGEFQINTHITSFQETPAVAMDATGNFVVSWTSINQDGSGFGIYARRYDSTGTPVGGEFLVNTTVAFNQVRPDVAIDADGDFVIVWASLNQDSSGFGVFGQRYDSTGTPISGEFPVNTTVAGDQDFPAVAIDADGDFVVTWHSRNQDGDGYGVYAQRYDAAGVAQGGEFPVSTQTTGNQAEPDIAMDDPGNFVIAWHSQDQDGYGYGIYAQRYTNTGATVGGEFLVNQSTGLNQANPSVAMDADGDFLVAWTHYNEDAEVYDVYYRRFTQSGTPATGELQASDLHAGISERPCALLSDSGNYTLMWQVNLPCIGCGDIATQAEVFAQNYDSNGEPL
ncbi:MAG: hypothetical protein ACAI44_15555 [Candidatus Sericytochromatia bacterium]